MEQPDMSFLRRLFGTRTPVDTRAAAHEAIAPKAQPLREQCVNVLYDRRLTADEVAGILNVSPLSIRPRLAELHKAGRVTDTGTRRPNSSGKLAVVWRLAA